MRSPTEPVLVTHAQRLLRSGIGRDDAAEQIIEMAAGDRGALADAVLYQVRRMHRLPSDDFDATAILRVLETALRATPWSEPGVRTHPPLRKEKT